MSRAFVVVALVAGGLLGLHIGIHHSGWVLALGLIGAVGELW